MSYLIIGENSEQKREAVEKIAKEIGIKISSNNPDLLVVEPEKSIGIEEVRRVKKFLSKKSWQGKAKLVIVLNAQLMTLEAQNAFLKTLEEPPPNSYLILLINNQSALLPTIVSRCQIIKTGLGPAVDCEPIWQQWQLMVKLTTGERMAKFEKINHGQELEIWLNNNITGLQPYLIKEATNRQEIANWLKLLITAKKMLKDNVGPQKVVDWLMLKI